MSKALDKPTRNNDASQEGGKSTDLLGLDSTLHAAVYGLDKGMVPLHAMSMNAKPIESESVIAKNQKGEEQLRFDMFKDDQRKSELNQNAKTMAAYFGGADGVSDAAKRAADEKLFAHLQNPDKKEVAQQQKAA